MEWYPSEIHRLLRRIKRELISAHGCQVYLYGKFGIHPRLFPCQIMDVHPWMSLPFLCSLVTENRKIEEQHRKTWLGSQWSDPKWPKDTWDVGLGRVSSHMQHRCDWVVADRSCKRTYLLRKRPDRDSMRWDSPTWPQSCLDLEAFLRPLEDPTARSMVLYHSHVFSSSSLFTAEARLW